MATFTAYVGALRPYWPDATDTEGVYIYPVAADLVVLDEDGVGLGGNGRTSQSSRLNTIISSPEGMELGDDVYSMRDKIVPSIRPLFPQIQETDIITVVWLDGTPSTNL